MKRQLRIAIWHNLPSGGGKRALYDNVKGLIARGHHLESWCPDSAEQAFLPLSELITEHIVPLQKVEPYFPMQIRSSGQVKELLRQIDAQCRVCANEINRLGFDILFVSPCMYVRTTPIAKYVHLPAVIFLHEPYRWFYEALPALAWLKPLPTEDHFLRLLVRRLRNVFMVAGVKRQAMAELEFARSFDRILANSVFSRESILRAYNLESKVCYLGIDTDYYRPSGEAKENFVVGLGTIYHAKGVDRAIRAVATIAKDFRPSLIWIGNGAFKADLQAYKQLALDLEVNFITKLHIPDNEVISLLSRAAAMIYTSRLEPFGYAPLEANACGTAVVAIAEGGVKETVLDGVNGFLVPDDDPLLLGHHLERLVTDLALARRLGESGRDYVVNKWNLSRGTDNIEQALAAMVTQGA